MYKNTLTHSHTHTLTHTHTHTLTHSRTHALTHSHTHTLTHSHTDTHSLSHTHTQTHTHTHTHTNTTCLSKPPRGASMVRCEKVRFRANSNHLRQSRPDTGLYFSQKSLNFQVVLNLFSCFRLFRSGPCSSNPTRRMSMIRCESVRRLLPCR